MTDRAEYCREAGREDKRMWVRPMSNVSPVAVVLVGKPWLYHGNELVIKVKIAALLVPLGGGVVEW